MNICAHEGLASALGAELKNGPITFRRFMELALYHPGGGYYRRERPAIGRAGDFKTSPHQSPWFGRMVARQAEQIWEGMGRPEPFCVFEAGPGEGWLAHDFLEAAGPMAGALEYTLAEQSPAAEGRIRERLAQWVAGNADGPRVRFVDSPEPPENFEGLIIAHEFLDALPAHILTQTPGGLMEPQLMERHVALENGRLEFCEGPLSDPRLAGWLEGLGIGLEEGQSGEVCLASADWTEAAGGRLRRGAILIFDYGFSARALYGPSRREGTIRGYRGHEMVSNPLEAPGECDLTAHVDFTTILRAAEHSGLTLSGFTDQTHYLLGLGLAEAMGDERGEDAQLAAERRRAMGLLDPGGLGGAIKVMLLIKNLGEREFPAFSMKPGDRESLATLRG